MDTLINFSGGVDSTYTAFEFLRNNPEDKLLLHHINLISPEAVRRHKKESIAVNNILNWFKQNKLNNFEYLETTFDYKSFGYTIKDVVIVMFITGVMLKNPKRNNIKKIIMPNNKNDFSRKDYENMELTRFKVFKDMVDRDIEFIFPIKEISKFEITQSLPKDLFDLTWYCRRPLRNGKPCGKCGTCEEVNTKI
ncbi:7-cyano-7-deazaguanine synthase [Candidatus Contubernalis alkaliaceticus]|uniref:7-cyano-7-deazaguanine synthase n=1 Tax=Candidatus Contubernalis alkaliaceticus TaxID=338645 RepID=UPI001F4C410A|nr:7-cyano-7-deazaguanine synthase [Candidatus Contubernalis alkalaceticus]UNC92709.1 hypothetical protein HUE98_11750 [Candidatus Contubernalis alkalaceticus]